MTHHPPLRNAGDKDQSLNSDLGTPPNGSAPELTGQRPPFGRRVFVNRTLRMESIRHIGFDLDWTLAAYDTHAMGELAFRLTLDRLVERFGYPAEISRAQLRSDFLRRGLLIDIEEGTVLKMNRHRYVGRAYHGRRFLEPSERAQLYRQAPINPASDRFYIVDTLFELPEVNLFSELVELKKEGVELPSYKELFRDARSAMDSIHADTTLKHKILADLPRFLPRDPDLPRALQRLRLGGRRLLLITNSEYYYTDALCRHLFADCLDSEGSWQHLFDLVVVSAGKPAFFRKDRPFHSLDLSGEPAEAVEQLAWGGIYAGGSREGLMELLQVPGEQVLYVGDHIYGDVLSPKVHSNWRTALIVSELEDELETLQSHASRLRHLEALRSEVADLGLHMDDLKDLVSLLRTEQRQGREAQEGLESVSELAQAERNLRDLSQEHKTLRRHAKRMQARISKDINPYWGSVFKQGGNRSLFGNQATDFACVYTSRVSNFAFYGSQHYYRVLKDPMMHERDD